ncbi:hypothetical protein EHP00_788 [Ecytonucleospora hepatopenaei]|uniref:Uncharacterized protein n=1 Tax=Ecytonucleospora hepatopenaei TaxID=646526 RepID=A0A1W0E7Y3_9MICR|nr:hypothetical protein EHP00_788 [Ecytonucleospora hepatopenaei]
MLSGLFTLISFVLSITKYTEKILSIKEFDSNELSPDFYDKENISENVTGLYEEVKNNLNENSLNNTEENNFSQSEKWWYQPPSLGETVYNFLLSRSFVGTVCLVLMIIGMFYAFIHFKKKVGGGKKKNKLRVISV